MSLNEVIKNNTQLELLNFNEINVSEKCADRIREVLTRNSDIFAEKDSETRSY